MTIKDLLYETKTSLLSNKTRTSLTVLGIVIGIASVIIMLSIGAGAQNSISSSISTLGTNVLTIRSGGGGGPGVASSVENNPLTINDVKVLEDKLTSAKYVAPSVQSRSQVIAGSKNVNTTIIGVTSPYFELSSIVIEEGTIISDKQNRSYSKVAVLGSTAKENLFSTADAIGKEIKIKSNTYIVVGVAKAKGGSGFSSPDENIYIPINTAMQYISGGTTVNSIAVSANNSSDMTLLQNEITDILLASHNIKDESLKDFRILNQADLINTASSITSIFTILLGSVAGISLLVGGIGIMNMMLTTVRERTKEIGLRKAIGAKKSDVRTQFLIESIVITVTGGIIGIMLGYLVSSVITLTGVISTSVSLTSVGLSFGVSVLIGIVFGYYPAQKASNLSPIDALRYE